jgi:hypothetical protein
MLDRFLFKSNNGKKIKRIDKAPSDKGQLAPCQTTYQNDKRSYFHANASTAS